MRQLFLVEYPSGVVLCTMSSAKRAIIDDRVQFIVESDDFEDANNIYYDFKDARLKRMVPVPYTIIDGVRIAGLPEGVIVSVGEDKVTPPKGYVDIGGPAGSKRQVVLRATNFVPVVLTIACKGYEYEVQDPV